METKTNKPKVSKEFHSCRCFAVETGETYGIEGEETDEPIYGPCGANTRREFAPGHDAKLKGALIKAHRLGQEFHWTDGGMLISGDPLSEAMKRGWAHFLTAPSGKVASRVAKTQPAPKRVKIGRWVYDILSILDQSADSVSVLYKTSKGETKTAFVKPEALVA